MVGGGSPHGHRMPGPGFTVPAPEPPTRRVTRGGGGAYRAVSGARHTDRTDTIAEADPPVAYPPGRARRPGTPDSPGRARGREGRAGPPYRTSPPPGHPRVSGHQQAVAPKQWPPTPAGAPAPCGPSDAEPPPGTLGKLTVGGGAAWAFMPPPRSHQRTETGGQRGTEGLHCPGAAAPPSPPPSPRSASGWLGDVGLYPPARLGEPPPPPPPWEDRGARGQAPQGARAARPRTITCPLCSHSDLGNLQHWPFQPARSPANRGCTRGPHGAPHGPRPDGSARKRT